MIRPSRTPHEAAAQDAAAKRRKEKLAMNLRPATKKFFEDLVSRLSAIHAELETLEDPAFEDDDSSLTAIMDNVKDAQDTCEELANG